MRFSTVDEAVAAFKAFARADEFVEDCKAHGIRGTPGNCKACLISKWFLDQVDEQFSVSTDDSGCTIAEWHPDGDINLSRVKHDIPFRPLDEESEDPKSICYFGANVTAWFDSGLYDSMFCTADLSGFDNRDFMVGRSDG